jgi:hypothetical protein
MCNIESGLLSWSSSMATERLPPGEAPFIAFLEGESVLQTFAVPALRSLVQTFPVVVSLPAG